MRCTFNAFGGNYRIVDDVSVLMTTPKELRKNAEDCQNLARATTEIYARMALIEMATEFRLMADGLERDGTRRTADRIRRRVASLRRRRPQGPTLLAS
jgi:hypothetical protein